MGHAYWYVHYRICPFSALITVETNLGEFFDLEALSVICAETGRNTFFFSSWPLNV